MDRKLGGPPPMGAPGMDAPKVNITPDMMKGFKTLTCDCGGQLFHSGIVIKKISAFVAPSGKEEMYPLEVLICESCGKVPNETDVMNIFPESVLATVTSTPFSGPPNPLSIVKDK